MAPKPKKTKEQIEEEKRLAEEAARLAEEERLRLEEEERKRIEELERQRQQLLEEFLSEEAARCQAEKDELSSQTGQIELERARAAEERRKDWEWERYLSCTHVPNPKDRIRVDDFLTLTNSDSPKTLNEALSSCSDCYKLLDELAYFSMESLLVNDVDSLSSFRKDSVELHRLVGQTIDRLSSHLLQFSDELANDKGEVQVGSIFSPQASPRTFRLALWVNTTKNPRMKTVEMPQINLVVDVPKQIALANVALRFAHRELDGFFNDCSNDLMAVGGVAYADLLALPPPAKKTKQWTLRLASSSTTVQRINYPIPPAGADPATYRSEEEVPPIGFTFPFSPNVILLPGEEVKVAHWDSVAHEWTTEGISHASVDPASHNLSFQTTRLIGPLAVVQSRTKHFPYRSWTIRPLGGRGGGRAAVSLDLGLPGGLLVIECGSWGVALHDSGAATAIPQLSSLIGRRYSRPHGLLVELSARGLHLLPEDRDAEMMDREAEAAAKAQAAALAPPAVVPPPEAEAEVKEGEEPVAVTPAPPPAADTLPPPSPASLPPRVSLKLKAAEEAMCMELGLLSGAFLISRSKWNQAASLDECIARISEVTDWAQGGRTEQSHLDRIFTKEKEDGDKRVLCITSRREGRGFAFIDALDKRESLVPLPGHESIESLKECMVSVWGQVHGNLLSLLKGSADQGGEGEGEDEGRKILTERLRASQDGLDLASSTPPVLSQVVGQLILLLRVFSFS